MNDIQLKKFKRILNKINALAPSMRELSDKELSAKTQEFKMRLSKGELLDHLVIEAFAAMREADRRILGMFPFDVQILGALALHYGYIAEMKTGEGKTLTATLPLYLNALTEKSTLLVTTNEYLAKRDAEEMGPVYRFMGLTVGVGVFDDSEEINISDKRAVYEADITYITSATLGFDYLSDNLAGNKNDKFLRSFHYAIVDEADAVLLDSAQTPLIVSGSPRVPSNLYDVSDKFVLALKKDQEYKVNKEENIVYLTEAGRIYAEEFFDIHDLYDGEYFELNRHINLALRAQHLYKKDVDYIVFDDEVKLIDNRTGRILEGTRLQSGIHQAIETKESVKRTKDSRAMASVTYQSLFNMFPKLAGMTGTGKLAEEEFISIYHLSVIVIPTNEPIQRIDYPDKVYVTLPEKLYATLSYVKELYDKRQPVLLISGTVDIAEIYSRMLLQEGIPHNVLTAKNTAKEALIIQEAGRKGTVTVATSLAGRGTDIKLEEGVAELGGLAVIGTERMPNSRIDWQLRGRAGRQGDPGLSQFFVSLEDELLIQYGGKRIRKFFENRNHKPRTDYGRLLTGRRFQRAIQRAQEKSEDKAILARESTVKFDESLRVQRHKIYALRDELIYEDTKLVEQIETIFNVAVDDYITQHPVISARAFRRYILENYTYEYQQFPRKLKFSDSVAIKNYLRKIYQTELDKKAIKLKTKEKFNEFLRLSILRAIDECWIEQVDYLQQLKSFVILRQMGQRDTITEYYHESLLSYEKMAIHVKHAIVRNIMLSSIDGNQEDGYSIYFV